MAATAPIQPLAWELPYAAGMALWKKDKTKQNNNNKKTHWPLDNHLSLRDFLGELGSSGKRFPCSTHSFLDGTGHPGN